MGGTTTPSMRRQRCAAVAWWWRLSLVVATAKHDRCPAASGKKYLTFAATGGLGNQYYNLRTAVWAARASDRTLVVPPLLPHGRLSASYSTQCTRTNAEKLVTSVQDRADRSYRQFSNAASWRRVLDLRPLEATGVKFVERAPLSLNVKPIPFCGKMTRGWTAFNITENLPATPVILRLGRAFGGSRGLDLDSVRPGCDLRGCPRKAAVAAWALAPSLRAATQFLRRRVRRPIVCAHLRTGKGETSTYRAFLDHSITALLKHLRTRSDGPAVYLASDMAMDEIRKLRSSSKAINELFTLCGGSKTCAFVGSQDSLRFGASSANLGYWRKLVGLSMNDRSARVLLDVATCVLADTFVQSPARTSSLAVLVNDLRRNASTAPCGIHDWAPGPRTGVVGFGEVRLAAAMARRVSRAGVGSEAYPAVT